MLGDQVSVKTSNSVCDVQSFRSYYIESKQGESQDL